MKLLLIGAGHAHLHLAKHCRDFIDRGIRVSLISPGPFWYSGLATGVLSAQYDPQEDQVDGSALIERQGGEFIEETLQGLDTERKQAVLSSGAVLNYDAISLNIGSEVPVDRIAGGREHGIPVKPISNLYEIRKKIEQNQSLSRVIVIGGGPTGCEVAVNIATLFKRLRRDCSIRLISKDERLVSCYAESVSQAVGKVLSDYMVDVIRGTAEELMEGGVVANGKRLDGDLTVLASGLAAPSLLARLGLAWESGEGILVNRYLQAVDRPAVFGAGDCIDLEGYRLPKIGVYGVREAPILQHNLLAYLLKKPMKPYLPQKKYLSILNFGDGTAFAVRDPFYWR